MPAALILGAFVVIFAVAAGTLLILVRAIGRASESAAEETSPDGVDWLTPIGGVSILKEESLSTISIWDRILARMDGMGTLRTRMSEAGLPWSVGRLTSMMLLAAAATGVIVWKLSFIPWFVCVALTLGAGISPYTLVLRRRSKRLLRLEHQFPDALDSLARSLRAGNSFAGALEILAREVPSPLGGELRRLVDQRKLGSNWEQLLEQLALRVPTAEFSVFAAAVQLHSRTGGRLHEVMEKLAETMRESAALKGEVRSIAAHGRMTGAILTFLPLAIAGMMNYVNPAFLLVLWRHPTGHMMIWVALGLLVTAHFVIRKMVDIRL
jgi:tight adherence protein B